MKKYTVSFSIVYRHTYEFVPVEEDDCDGVPESCDRDGCECTGHEEVELTSAEVDAFMREVACSHMPRYVWYAKLVLPYDKVTDITYADGGMITFTVETSKKRKQILQELMDYREVFYDSGPGSEAVVPTLHRYSYLAMCTMETGYTENERGRIDIDTDTLEITTV